VSHKTDRVREINDLHEALRRAHLLHPQLRLGQFLLNYVVPDADGVKLSDDVRVLAHGDSFYTPDHEMLYRLTVLLRDASGGF
jgi:hypothetical protein